MCVCVCEYGWGRRRCETVCFCVFKSRCLRDIAFYKPLRLQLWTNLHVLCQYFTQYITKISFHGANVCVCTYKQTVHAWVTSGQFNSCSLKSQISLKRQMNSLGNGLICFLVNSVGEKILTPNQARGISYAKLCKLSLPLIKPHFLWPWPSCRTPLYNCKVTHLARLQQKRSDKNL